MISIHHRTNNKFCQACLVGDEVRFVEIGKKMRYFKEFLKLSISTKTVTNYLCFECAHRIDGILSFSDKVIAANTLLEESQKKSSELLYDKDIKLARNGLCFPSLTVYINKDILDVQHNEDADVLDYLKSEIDEDELKSEIVYYKDEEPVLVDVDIEIKKEYSCTGPEEECGNDDEFNNDSDDDALMDIKERIISNAIQRPIIKKKRIKRINRSNLGKKVHTHFLTKREVLEDLQRQSSLAKYRLADYKCELCIKGFSSEDLYEKHMEKHNEKSGSHKCDVCQQYFTTKGGLNHHVWTHRKRYKCSECDFFRTCWSVVTDHYSDVHERKDKSDIQCNICGKTFSKQNTYRKHACHQEKIKCEICDKTMLKTSMSKHVSDIHTEEKPFECKVCQQRFAKSQSLRLHVSMRHPEGMEFCADCNLFFTNKGGLRNHLKMTLKHVKEEDLKQCPHCPVKLPYWKCITHIDREHRIGSYVCNLCNGTYASRTSLHRHTRVAHQHIKKERKYVCETCGKGFTVKKTLNSHMNIHTGARPYSCGSCDATFAHPAALYTHNRLVHLKIKRKCDLKKIKTKTEGKKKSENSTNTVIHALSS